MDPTSDRPVYKQVADDLRQQISAGELQPGQALPSEPYLLELYGIGRNTLRQALSVLRGEGLIETTSPRYGNRVRQELSRTEVPLGAGAEVTARMPTEAERHAHGMPLGVPVLVLLHPDGTEQVLPADKFSLVAGDD